MATTLDRRVRRTKRLLAEALIALVLEKRYDEISISEITERAGVGYATFFRHYPHKPHKDALLYEVLDVVLAGLTEVLMQPEALDDPLVMGAALFSFVERNSQICRVLLGRQGPVALRERMVAHGTEQALARYGPPPDGVVPPEIAAHHLSVGSIALIQWWLDHGMPYPPERMAAIYRDLVALPSERFLRSLDVQR